MQNWPGELPEWFPLSKIILRYCEKLRAQGNATDPSQQLSWRVWKSRVQLLCLFLPSPPSPIHGWNYLSVSPCEFFCCASSLCPFSHTEKTLPVCWIIEVKLLANSKSGSAHLQRFIWLFWLWTSSRLLPVCHQSVEEQRNTVVFGPQAVLLSPKHFYSLSPF